MEFKDYYALLGVKPDADNTAIKTAYDTENEDTHHYSILLPNSVSKLIRRR